MGEGKGGMIGENSIETYILPYVKHDQSKCNAWNRAIKSVHWDNPEGRDGDGGGRRFGMGGHMYTSGWFMSMYGKDHHNTVK